MGIGMLVAFDFSKSFRYIQSNWYYELDFVTLYWLKALLKSNKKFSQP